MAEHVWTVLCERSSIDKESNQVSLFNVIERIEIEVEKSELEKIHKERESGRRALFKHQMHLMTWWVRSEREETETVEIRIVNYAPDGSPGNTSVSGSLDLVTYKSIRMKVEIGGVAYKGDGRYWLQLEEKRRNKWKPVARLPVLIYLRESSETSEDGTSPES